MSVLVVGMSHQSAPVTLLERLSMDSDVTTTTCGRLMEEYSLSEAMIISTCNRLEIYAVTSAFHSGVEDVVRVLHEVSGVPEQELRSYLYVRYADAAAEHLMSVTAGLDSMVVGEQQIIGQVRSSYQSAAQQGTVGPRIHALAQSALHAGKRVHSETQIDEAGPSMVSFAFERALGTGRLEGKKVLIVGAGAMASLAATTAGKLGAELIVANRTLARAERLADHARQAGVVASVREFRDRAQAVREADVVVSAIGAHDFTVRAQDLAGDKPVVLIDLSLPRDIDPACANVPGARLINIESLSLSAKKGVMTAGPQAQARSIVREELQAYSSAQRVRDVAPAVSALRKHAANLVECEAARLAHKHPELDAEQNEDIARALKRVVDKLLHQPMVRAKELAATEGSVSHETALQDLFGLDMQEESVAVDVTQLPTTV